MSTKIATAIIHFPERTRVDPTPRYDEPAKIIILPVIPREHEYDKQKLPVVIGAPPWKR